MFGMAAVEAEPEAVFGGLALVEANQKPRQYYCPLGCETGDERLGGRLDSARGPDLKIVRQRCSVPWDNSLDTEQVNVMQNNAAK